MKFKNSRGFSLLEIIVAMLIMSLVVAGLFGLFVTSHGFIIEAGHRLQAINYARQVAETLKVYVSADPTNTPTGAVTALGAEADKPYTDSGITITPAEAIPGVTTPQCTYTVIDGSPGAGMKAVTITTSWTEP